MLNGVGHDDFADRMIEASEKPDVAVIEANQNVPLLAATGNAARGAGKVVNPLQSISASIAQVNNIARELGKLDPANANTYTPTAPTASACANARCGPGQADPSPEPTCGWRLFTPLMTTCCASSA